MSDMIEGLGTAAEGGLFARVLEPPSGARDANPHQPGACLNCGTPLTGAFCGACGQPGHIHRTISAIGHDLLHGALHFEGRLWRTLPMLAIRPGPLTRRYIEGQRARFVSPMALFLFSVFLMFAVFQMVGLTAPTNVTLPDVAPNLVQVREQAEARRDEARTALNQLPADDPARAEAQALLAEREDVLAGIDRVPVPDIESFGSANINLTGLGTLDDQLISKWTENPGLMFYKLQANAYKFSWLLIPISIPFMWLLFFWKRRFRAYDHAIFVTYSLSFMTLLFVVLSALGATVVQPGGLVIAAGIIVPLHIYKQLRGAYQLSRFSALWRLCVLLVLISIIIVLFLQLLLILGAF